MLGTFHHPPPHPPLPVLRQSFWWWQYITLGTAPLLPLPPPPPRTHWPPARVLPDWHCEANKSMRQTVSSRGPASSKERKRQWQMISGESDVFQMLFSIGEMSHPSQTQSGWPVPGGAFVPSTPTPGRPRPSGPGTPTTDQHGSGVKDPAGKGAKNKGRAKQRTCWRKQGSGDEATSKWAGGGGPICMYECSAYPHSPLAPPPPYPSTPPPPHTHTPQPLPQSLPKTLSSDTSTDCIPLWFHILQT